MPIPDSVVELIARYKENRAEYHSGQYNETQTRIDFVNPLFAALGWDMDNHAGLPEAYREVIHEAAIKIGGATKAPDYSFGVGGRRKFFLETKKPTVVLNLKLEPAYQLRRYAWTAKMPVSILTNFEEFVIYDGRVPPDQKDSPKKARLDYFKYTEYPDKWDELAARFSQAAVLSGDFDKYAEAAALFKASTPVDAAFLSQISAWREKLARNIALNNSGLAPRQLNYAVQMIIDRIIFLRICEDRGIETLHRLRGVTTGTGTYARLLQIFLQADDRYNSGLFHFKKEKDRDDFDDVTPSLTIDDRLLKEIIAGIYFPESPFEFSVFPADILGQVYEQFLGKVIRVEGRTATVEDKPEVKKAGGVYYTPTYIVDYIVRQTVGKLVEGKTPKQVSALRVLDPACGSGSFLIGAYQFLLDWHTHWYLEDDAMKWQKGKAATIYQAKGGVWRLTTAERRRILLNNIYGVDIDTQAVEVTKLSLLLKVLEGESAEVLDHTLKLYHERALPDLETNIKCGNSLIGSDFYDDSKMAALDMETQLRVNAFDWQAEFHNVMNASGFDAVVGNPPYIFGEYHDANAKSYFRQSFTLANKQYDTYWMFIEKGLLLTREGGRFSLIVPDALLARDEPSDTRRLLLTHGLDRAYHCGLVFVSGVSKPGVSATVFNVVKGAESQEIIGEVRVDTTAVQETRCSRQRFLNDPLTRFLIHMSDAEAAVLSKVHSVCRTFGDSQIFNISRGEEIGKQGISRTGSIPILVGEDISRYQLRTPTRFLERFDKPAELYVSPKIVAVKTGVQCVAALDTGSLVRHWILAALSRCNPFTTYAFLITPLSLWRSLQS